MPNQKAKTLQSKLWITQGNNIQLSLGFWFSLDRKKKLKVEKDASYGSISLISSRFVNSFDRSLKHHERR